MFALAIGLALFGFFFSFLGWRKIIITSRKGGDADAPVNSIYSFPFSSVFFGFLSSFEAVSTSIFFFFFVRLFVSSICLFVDCSVLCCSIEMQTQWPGYIARHVLNNSAEHA